MWDNPVVASAVMELDLILVDAVAGGVSGLVGFLVAGRLIDRKKRPQVFLLTLVAFVVAGGQIIPAFLNPQIRAWRADRELSALLDSDPLFQGVLADHPELRAPLFERFKEAYVTGDGEISVQAGSMILGPVLPEYIVGASDDAVREFAEAQLTTMRALQPDGDRCFKFANPNVDGGVVLTDEEGRAAIQEAVRNVVSSARRNPLPAPTVDGKRLLETVSAELYEQYGEDVNVLASAEDPELDRALYCEVVISLYDRILALPEPESAGVLRHVMGLESP